MTTARTYTHVVADERELSITVNYSSRMLSEMDDEQELRARAIARLEEKRDLIGSLTTFVGVNGLLWLIWALTDRSTDGGVPWPTWVSAIWGFFIVMHVWKIFARRPISEADIQREIDRHRPSS
jgi:2TM domain